MGYRSSPCGRAPMHLSWLVGLLLGETTWVGSPGPCGWAFLFLPQCLWLQVRSCFVGHRVGIRGTGSLFFLHPRRSQL